MSSEALLQFFMQDSSSSEAWDKAMKQMQNQGKLGLHKQKNITLNQISE